MKNILSFFWHIVKYILHECAGQQIINIKDYTMTVLGLCLDRRNRILARSCVFNFLISSFQDLDAKILQTASQKQIVNDKKRREAFKKILSDIIGVGIVLIIVFVFLLNENFNIDQC